MGAIFALALGFASCDKNKSNEPENSGIDGTFAKISFKEAGLRALTDGQNDAVGTEEESTVNKAAFFVTGSVTNVETFTKGAENTWVSKPFQYNGATGTQNMGLVVNEHAALAEGDFDATKTVAISDLSKLADVTSKSFTMSAKLEGAKGEIKPGVAEGQVATGNNLFPFEVERVVSKVQVSQPDAGITLTVPGYEGATIANPRFAVAGSATSLYLFPDNAGTRKLEDPSTSGVFKYTGLESAIHANALSTFTEDKLDKAREGVSKVSELSLVAAGADDNWDTLNSMTIESDANYTTASNAKGIYFMENSLPVDIKEKGQVDYRDVTHVKIYAQFIPADGQVLKLEGDNLVPATPNEVAADHNETVGTDDITNPAGTFYKGNDNKLYLTLSAALKAGNSNAEKFTGGKMVWKVPANAQPSTDANKEDQYYAYMDTRRNNIYSIQVNKIVGLGANYDKVDPTDPNIPKPNDNPKEPTKPEKDPVDPAYTYVAVSAKILDWNLVHRGVELK